MQARNPFFSAHCSLSHEPTKKTWRERRSSRRLAGQAFKCSPPATPLENPKEMVRERLLYGRVTSHKLKWNKLFCAQDLARRPTTLAMVVIKAGSVVTISIPLSSWNMSHVLFLIVFDFVHSSTHHGHHSNSFQQFRPLVIPSLRPFFPLVYVYYVKTPNLWYRERTIA